MNQEIKEAIAILEKVLKPLDASEPQCKLNLNPEKIKKALTLLRKAPEQQPIAGSNEIIELLGKIENNASVPLYVNTCGCGNCGECIWCWLKQLFALLHIAKEQQPTAGELTKRIRLNFKGKTLFRGNWPQLHFKKMMKGDVLEACDRLDRAEARLRAMYAGDLSPESRLNGYKVVTDELTKCRDELREENVRIREQRKDLLEACEAQHQAIDRLFALLIEKDEKFFPSKSGQPWEAIQQGNVAIAKAKQ